MTIVVAAYNASATIRRALTSILSEPEVAEIIVIDDASTDDTARIAESIVDAFGRIRVLRQTLNLGPSAARNRAIEESSAPWIGILDADDFFLPGRIKGLLSYSADADLVADDLWQVQETAVDGPRKSLLGSTMTGARDVGFVEFVLSNVSDPMVQRKELGFIKPIIRRQFLDEYKIRYVERMRLGEDYELYARSLANGARLKLVPAQGYVSVVRANSLSGLHTENDLQNLRDSNDSFLKDLALSPEEKLAVKAHYLSVDCRLQWRLLINAVKKRDAGAALLTFRRPYPVPSYLLRQLWEQVVLRSTRRFKKAAS